MLGELKLMPPRTAMKVNCLVMRHLHFGGVRGDLQELRHEQPAAAFAIRRLRPWLATASSSTHTCAHGHATASFGGDTEVA